MARQLTKKQRGFVKDYVKEGNGVKAALQNYDTVKYNVELMFECCKVCNCENK